MPGFRFLFKLSESMGLVRSLSEHGHSEQNTDTLSMDTQV